MLLRVGWKSNFLTWFPLRSQCGHVPKVGKSHYQLQGDDSLSFLLGLLEHPSGGDVGVPLQPGRVKVEAPHWAFVDVSIVYENNIRMLYSDSPPMPTLGKHESLVCPYTFALISLEVWLE